MRCSLLGCEARIYRAAATASRRCGFRFRRFRQCAFPGLPEEVVGQTGRYHVGQFSEVHLVGDWQLVPVDIQVGAFVPTANAVRRGGLRGRKQVCLVQAEQRKVERHRHAARPAERCSYQAEKLIVAHFEEVRQEGGFQGRSGRQDRSVPSCWHNRAAGPGPGADAAIGGVHHPVQGARVPGPEHAQFLQHGREGEVGACAPICEPLADLGGHCLCWRVGVLVQPGGIGDQAVKAARSAVPGQVAAGPGDWQVCLAQPVGDRVPVAGDVLLHRQLVALRIAQAADAAASPCAVPH